MPFCYFSAKKVYEVNSCAAGSVDSQCKVKTTPINRTQLIRRFSIDHLSPPPYESGKYCPSTPLLGSFLTPVRCVSESRHLLFGVWQENQTFDVAILMATITALPAGPLHRLVKFKAYYQYSGLLIASTQHELPVIGSISSLTND